MWVSESNSASESISEPYMGMYWGVTVEPSGVHWSRVVLQS